MINSPIYARAARLCFVLCIALSMLPLVSMALSAEAPKTNKPKTDAGADAFQDIEWSAFKQSFVEDKGIIVLSGNATVKYKGVVLEADNIVFYKLTREMYAEGNARLRLGESEVNADKAYIDATRNLGYLTQATVRVSRPADAFSKNKVPNTPAEKTERIPEKDETSKPENTTTSAINFIRTRDPFGVYINPAEDPQARANLIFRAEKLIILSQNHLSAENGFITSDDMVHPMYGIKTGTLDFYLEDDPKKPGQLQPQKLVAQRAQLTLFGYSLFPFPTITIDMVRHNPFFQVLAGHSSRFGYFELSRLGYATGLSSATVFNPTHIYLDLDERTKRGPGAGFEIDWLTGSRPEPIPGETVQFERGVGHLRAYGVDEITVGVDDDVFRARQNLERRIQPQIDGFPRRVYDANILFAQRRFLDNAGAPSTELNLYGGDVRGWLDFQHHQPLKHFAGVDNLLLDFRYERQSDSNVTLEYAQNNFMRENQPEALASVRKPGDNYSLEFLYRGDPQDFEGGPARSPYGYGTFTGYEPALTYSLAPTPLKYGFNISGELQAAHMRETFDRDIYDQNALQAGRVYGIVDVSRPLKWGPVNFVPHVGTQQQGYDRSRSEGAISQGAATYGLDVTSRFYGTFSDVENEALGIKGLRHIIEPYIYYSGVSDTRTNPVNIYDFDQVDDLTRLDKVTFGIDQNFQTRADKDGSVETVNFAGVNMGVDYFPNDRDQDRLLHGEKLDLYRLDSYIRVLDAAKLNGAVGYSMEDGNLETASVGFSVDPHSRWRLSFEERFNYSDTKLNIVGSDQYRVKVDYKLSERWGVSYEEIYEKRRSLLVKNGRQLEKLTATRSYGSLDASFSYTFDQVANNHTVFFMVKPNAIYRNLVVPSQDLLVSSAEVAGEGIEAPEERNFDPFELLKQRRKKKTPTESTPVSPDGTPAPAPGGAPVPPPPTPSKSISASDVFKDPSVAKSKKVDDDDWVTPPSTPASARPQQ